MEDKDIRDFWGNVIAQITHQSSKEFAFRSCLENSSFRCCININATCSVSSTLCLGSVLARLLLPWCPYGPARGSSEAVLACPLPYGSPLPSCLLAGSWAKTCVSDS